MEHIYYDYSNTLEEISDKYELKTLSEKTRCLKENMSGFKLRLLFVGAFSAGKSAIINAALERELLTENQRPETAVASELIYDSREYIEAVKDSERTQYSIEQADEIDVEEYDYLIWHIDNDFLKRSKDCVIVDMPGFNSGIKNHNNAILKYVGSGNSYILVIDCEDGAVKKSISDFINEIKNYDNNAAVVITKTDIKMPDDVEKVKNSVALSAANLFGKNVDIVDTNKFDEQAPQKIEQLLTRIDKVSVFSQEYYSEVYSIAVGCLDALELYRKSIDLNLEDYDREIEAHYKAGRELSEKLERERKKLENRFQNDVAESVLCDVQNALYNNAETLAAALRGGEKNFAVTVNNILRPVLYNSTKTYSENAFGKFLSEFEFYDNMNSEDSFSQESVYNAIEHFKDTGSRITALSEKADQFGALYKTVTTALAVVTNVVAPWLELVLIFLPEIMKFIGKARQENELRNKVSNQIIPQIVERLRPEISNSIQQIKDQMLEETEKQILAMMNTEAEALEQAKEMKKIQSDDINSKLSDVDYDINRINEIVNSLT